MAKRTKKRPSKHYLYSASVQSVEADLDFFKRVYRRERGQPFRLLREDFCGTAVLAHEWVRRNAKNRAWGVDLDAATLEWGTRHYGPVIGRAAERLQLLERNVLDADQPQVDVVAALNFSYSTFKTRDQLGQYFRRVRESLRPGGMLFLDAWGGFDAMTDDKEKRPVDAETAYDGTKIPAFTYIWEQARFNPVDHHIVCHISFKLRGGVKIKRAFTYDWRLWSLPELRELLCEAGFAKSTVYVEGWDDDVDEPDGIFRKKKKFDNSGSWVAYVVGAV